VGRRERGLGAVGCVLKLVSYSVRTWSRCRALRILSGNAAGHLRSLAALGQQTGRRDPCRPATAVLTGAAQPIDHMRCEAACVLHTARAPGWPRPGVGVPTVEWSSPRRWLATSTPSRRGSRRRRRAGSRGDVVAGVCCDTRDVWLDRAFTLKLVEQNWSRDVC
jgi:hypothetical protein